MKQSITELGYVLTIGIWNCILLLIQRLLVVSAWGMCASMFLGASPIFTLDELCLHFSSEP